MNNTNLTTPVPAAAASDCPVSKPVDRDLQVAMYTLLIIASLIGNILIIIIVTKNKRMHTVANYLITNMSFADLLITLLPMNWEVLRLMHYPSGEWPMGRFMCSFVFMCIYLSVACSILSLIVITFDRFFAIIFPLKQILTKKVLPFLLIFIWIGAFAFASPTVYAMELQEYDGTLYCVESWKPPFDAKSSPVHYTIILFIGLYALPLTTMAIMYSAIAWKLWKRVIPGNSSSETEKQLLKQKKKVIKMLVVISLTFAICWLPVFTMQFLYFTNEYYQRCYVSFPQWFLFLAYFMQYLGSAVNPYIYFTFSESYRRGFKNVLNCFRKVQPNGSITSQLHFSNSTKRHSLRTSHIEKPSPRHDAIQLTEKSKPPTIKEEPDMMSTDNLTALDKNSNNIN